MIDWEKHARIVQGTELHDSSEPQFPFLAGMDMAELLQLHSQIEALLPATSLSGMNLEKELVLQYSRVKALQDRVLTDTEVPVNQLAQVANSVAATLQQLTAMQTKFHTAERFKEIESRLIRALENVPNEYLVEFFAWYESEDT